MTTSTPSAELAEWQQQLAEADRELSAFRAAHCGLKLGDRHDQNNEHRFRVTQLVVGAGQFVVKALRDRQLGRRIGQCAQNALQLLGCGHDSSPSVGADTPSVGEGSAPGPVPPNAGPGERAEGGDR